MLFDGFFKQFTGSKPRFLGCLDLNSFACSRISPLSGFSIGNLEDAETGDINLVAFSQGIGNNINESVYPLYTLLFGDAHFFG